MFVTVHVLSGVAIGRLAGRSRAVTPPVPPVPPAPPVPLVPRRGAIMGALAAAGTGLASHLVLDALPHWGRRHPGQFLPAAVADGLTALLLGGWLARRCPGEHRTTVLAGMLGAVLPDLNKPAVLLTGSDPSPAWFGRIHERVQREAPEWLWHEALAAGLGLALAAQLTRR